MQLPGGIWNGRECRKDFAFMPVTGQLELAILESQARQPCVANQVTEVLVAALDALAGRHAGNWIRRSAAPHSANRDSTPVTRVLRRRSADPRPLLDEV